MKKYILLLIVPFLMFSQEETPDIWHFSNENNSGSCIKGDCENGYGIYQWHSGEKYEGEFKKWELLSGVLIFTNGDRYEGSFVFNEREGYGIYTYSNGDKYEGEWEMDDIYGKGKMVYKYGYSGKLSDIKEICDCSNALYSVIKRAHETGYTNNLENDVMKISEHCDYFGGSDKDYENCNPSKWREALQIMEGLY